MSWKGRETLSTITITIVRFRFPKVVAIIAVSLFLQGHRGYQFTVDPDPEWTLDQLSGSNLWNQTLSMWDVSGVGESTQVRDTDASVDQEVEVRYRNVLAPANECNMSAMTNYIDAGNNYLFQFRRTGNQVRILKVISTTITVIGTASQSITDNTNFNLKGTSADNGSNKDLELFVDGVSKVTASTSDQLGSGQAGVRVLVVGATGACRMEWWIFDTNLAITTVNPNRGSPSGGFPTTIAGIDIGEGTIFTIGGTNATGIATTPATQITGTVPAGGGGSADVVMLFGTLGSEERSVTLINGFRYGVGGILTLGAGP